MGKLEFGKPLGGPRRVWEDNIKMSVKETIWGVLDWVHLSEGGQKWRSFCEHGNEPEGFVKCRGGGFKLSR